jgi:hypothetical protein
MTLCALIVSPAAFSSPVTYDYTGVITYFFNAGNTIAIGSQVSGTYTFDLANGNPAQSSGTIGSGNWAVVSAGGPFYSAAVPSLLPFASTAHVDGFVYATPLPPLSSSIYADSEVLGVHNDTGRGSTFTAGESYEVSPDNAGTSSLGIDNPHGAYSANGLPILAGATSAMEEVTELLGRSEIVFNITSLKIAPEIDPASAAGGLTLLFSGLAMALGAPRSGSPEHRKGCAVA